MLSRNKQPFVAMVAAVTFIALNSTGCRSGRSGWNMFSWRGEPSAESLAGTGPTETYPQPPSATATPNAIDSIAAGIEVNSGVPETSPAAGPTTGFGATASLGTGANPVAGAMAAANANGFGATQPVGFTAGEANPSANPSGQFGSQAFIPKAVQAGGDVPSYAAAGSATAPSIGPTGGSATASPSNYQPPTSNYQLGAATAKTPTTESVAPNGFTPPGLATSASTSPSPSPSAAGGFTMTPEMSPALAEATASATPPVTSAAADWSGPQNLQVSANGGASSGLTVQPGSFSTKADAKTPEFSTAGFVLPAEPGTKPSSENGSYTPGSTFGAGSYPTGGFGSPTGTSGTIYR